MNVPPKYGKGLRLIIGDMPSEEDAIKGVPFSDGTGRVLEMLLRKAGIRIEDVTLLTLLDYRPREGKFPQDIGEVKRCIREHVMPVLLARPWTRADIIGEEALKYLCGKRESISLWRGSPLPIDLDKLQELYS
jgi:uracil-DNA glycosylase family 4